jgi:hypothetical protein
VTSLPLDLFRASDKAPSSNRVAQREIAQNLRKQQVMEVHANQLALLIGAREFQR